MQDYLIRKINHGIACRIGNVIYYNKKLEKYPKLLEAIILHEKKHTSGLSTKDILMDLRNDEISSMKREYYKFILQNPSSLTELLPCWRYDGKLVINPMISILWIITISIIGVIWSIVG